MAGDWMMIDLELSDKPEVHQIAALLQLDPDAVVGKLVRVWSWFDKQTVDGHAPSVTHSVLDRLTAREGFGEAMAKAGWLNESGNGLDMPKFDRWNGQSAKKRALTNRRQTKKRNANVTPTSRIERDKNVTREEKRRTTTPLPPSGAFAKFWQTYPRKKSMGQAEKAWLKIKPNEQLSEHIIASVEQAKTSADWKREGGRFIPYPASWLNAKGWEDEIGFETQSNVSPLYSREGVM